MELQIFAIRDKKTDMYATPMFQHNKGEAIRSLADAVNNGEKDNILFKHPEDYELFHLGSYNTTTGVITGNGQPVSVVNVDELVKRNG